MSSSNFVVTAGTAPYGDPPGGERMQPVAFDRSPLCLRDDVAVPDVHKLAGVLHAAVRDGHVRPAGPKRLWVTELSWEQARPAGAQSVGTGLRPDRRARRAQIVELATDVAMLRTFIRSTAAEMDSGDRVRGVSDRVSMCNYRANRLACDAADRAMQVHGGLGYTRAKPFEHIYRHHRRYRITEGSEEMQIRNVAGHLFGFIRR